MSLCTWTRWLTTLIPTLIFLLGTDWLFHAVILQDWYANTEQLWRDKATLASNMWWMFGGQALFALTLIIIFGKNYEHRGWMEGIRFGWWMGVLLAAPIIMSHSYAAIPAKFVWAWSGIGIFQTMGVGLILCFAYKNMNDCPA